MTTTGAVERLRQRFPIFYDRICHTFSVEKRLPMLQVLSELTIEESVLLLYGWSIIDIDDLLKQHHSESDSIYLTVLTGIIFTYNNEIRHKVTLSESQIKFLAQVFAEEYFVQTSRKSRKLSSSDSNEDNGNARELKQRFPILYNYFCDIPREGETSQNKQSILHLLADITLSEAELLYATYGREKSFIADFLQQYHSGGDSSQLLALASEIYSYHCGTRNRFGRIGKVQIEAITQAGKQEYFATGVRKARHRCYTNLKDMKDKIDKTTENIELGKELDKNEFRE